MNHSTLIARKIAEVLKTTGYSCTITDTSLLLDNWSVRIHILEGETRRRPDGTTMIFPAIVTSHRYLPHGYARELGVGLGSSLPEAANAVSANWIMLFFPLLKFLFEEHPHDCLVHEEPVDLSEATRPYRLLAGPVQMIGFEDAQPRHFSQSHLWNAFSSALVSKLGFSADHVRCYVAKTPSGPTGDVFVDRAEWTEGSQRLRQIAATFPEPTEANPLYALKQHLFVRPQDFAVAASDEESRQIVEWTKSLAGRVDDSTQRLLPQVLQALYVLGSYASQDEQERTLIEKGVSPEVANSLLSFLQSAAARVVLQGKAQFSDTYYLANYQTRRAIECRYDQTPEFTAALKIFTLLRVSGLAETEISIVADSSAEMNAIRQAAAEKLTGMKFTQMVHTTARPIDGVDLDTLLSAPKKPAATAPSSLKPKEPKTKPWWKVW